MAAQAGSAGGERQSLAVRLWWVFPLAMLVAVVVAAMRHREQPLTIDRLDPQVLAALPQAAASVPGGGDAFVRRRRIHTAGLFAPGHSIDKTTLRHLGRGLFLRSDDEYELVGEVQGQRAIFEERAITWRGLLTLHRVERQPAVIYHDIYADEGWLVQSTAALQMRVDADFPQRDGSRLQATVVRIAPPQASPSGPKRFERSVACVSEGTLEAASVLPGGTGALRRVVCDSVQRPLDVDAAREKAARIASRSEYVHLPGQDYFLLLSVSTEDHQHPYDSAEAPRRRNEHHYRVLEWKPPPAEGAQPPAR